jgi:hypothetical protein
LKHRSLPPATFFSRPQGQQRSAVQFGVLT